MCVCVCFSLSIDSAPLMFVSSRAQYCISAQVLECFLFFSFLFFSFLFLFFF